MEILSRLGLALSVQVASAAALAQTSSTTFYGTAHEDNWQLFMTPNAIYDVITGGNKTVFIYFTAGDAGCGTGCASPIGSIPYYQVREDAAISSVRFAASLTTTVSAGTASDVTVNGHSIYRYVLGPTVSYFLHLPDGNVNGAGYSTTGFQSLLRLQTGQISSIAAIDGSTTYRSWSDLVNTVRGIIQAEALGPDVWINTHDPNSSSNPNDHADHYASGAAMQTAASAIACINQAYFVGYSKSSLAINLGTSDAYLQSANYGTMVSGVVDYGFDSTYLSEQGWLGRLYFRTVVGSGSCATATASATTKTASTQSKSSSSTR